MPRYFFDISDGRGSSHDDYGDDCVDDQEARDLMIAILADIAQDELPDKDHYEFTATLRNDQYKTIYRMSLTLDGKWK